ncbi:MAG: hypothetical protein ACHQ4H_15755 [Ktedonobacterales bacterium]
MSGSATGAPAGEDDAPITRPGQRRAGRHESLNLTVDESLLTGESVPVRKVAAINTPAAAGIERGDAAAAQPGGDDQPYVYSGTLVVQGRGIAEVLATGPRSQMGRIGQAIQGGSHRADAASARNGAPGPHLRDLGRVSVRGPRGWLRSAQGTVARRDPGGHRTRHGGTA